MTLDIYKTVESHESAIRVHPRDLARSPGRIPRPVSCMLKARRVEPMSECKHGLRQGCVYCHGHKTGAARQPSRKKQTRASRLSEQMNDRVTALKRRLRDLRGES